MKAQELRIGNLVKYDNRIFEIDSIAKVFPTLNTTEFGIGVVDYNNIEPILLTEEWLLRMGFISNPYQDRYENVVIHVECNKTRGVTELWIDKMPHIKYLHELQNLYFALTGKELIHDEWIVTKDNYPSIVDILKD